MILLAETWNILAQLPLLWLSITLFAYYVGNAIWQYFNRFILFQPLIIASSLIIFILVSTGTPYKTYFDGAQFIHFLLGPATVALGIPLYENRKLVRGAFLPVIITLIVGAICATLSTLLIALWLGAPKEILISLAPKSITTPVAMAISGTLGGDVALTSAIVVLTGVGGTLCAPFVIWLCRIKDRRAQGLAIGISSHGIGTAYAFQQSAVMGSFSSLGMGASCIITSLLIPPLLKLLGII